MTKDVVPWQIRPGGRVNGTQYNIREVKAVVALLRHLPPPRMKHLRNLAIIGAYLSHDECKTDASEWLGISIRGIRGHLNDNPDEV